MQGAPQNWMIVDTSCCLHLMHLETKETRTKASAILKLLTNDQKEPLQSLLGHLVVTFSLEQDQLIMIRMTFSAPRSGGASSYCYRQVCRQQWRA